MDAADSFLQAELDSWCQKAIVDQKHAVLLLGVPADLEVAHIEETVQKVKALGRVRVRDYKEGPTPGFLLVLCECKEVVDPSRLPVDVIPEGGGKPWKMVAAKSAESPPAGFAEKLSNLLVQEGKSISDLQAMFSSPSSNAGSPEAIIRAVGELLEKTSKPVSDGSAYRRLRSFSGTVPIPTGEEALETWMDQARMMVMECECSEKEKRRRIIESLKGSALDVVKAVRFSNPDATSLQYLEALDGAFGTPESGEDLYFAFRLLRQNPGEALSDFLKRMEKSLTRVGQKGGLPGNNVDRTRVEQLIRGAVESDLLLLQLRLRERRENPPTFLTLLNEIREAEESEAARYSLGATAKPVPRPRLKLSGLAAVRELKAEIQELRTKVTEGPKVPVSKVMLESKPEPSRRGGDTLADPEVLSLRRQVQRLEEQLASLSVRQSFQSSKEPPPEQAVTSTKPRLEMTKDDYFCYKCGEDGHIAPRCKATENYSLVIQKLVRSLRKARSGKMDESGKQSGGKASFSRKSQTVVVEKSSLPAGLVGPALTITMKINGQSCEALLDSGSQVTIIFDSWYSKNQSSVPIQPLSGLSIWGLSTASYPYKGYVLVDVSFPASVMGVEESVSILALVCPEPEGPEQVPVIIGTNASFFQRLIGLNTAGPETDVAHALRIQLHNAEVIPPTKLVKEKAVDMPAGEVKWAGPDACIIPSRGEMCAVCTVESQQPLEKEILVVESPSDDTLPAGLFILPVVLPSSAVEENKVRVLIKNETCKEITIPVGTVIAHVFPTDTVTAASDVPTKPKRIDPKLFDFSKSEIPKQWEDRLRQKLCERGNVFSVEEWDVGLAKDVKHHIRLSDSKPFRERSRRIAPADIDDVRRHLKDLLAAGIIKESRSPYASPIVIVRKKSGAIRMCIDYRTLNSRTLPDQYTTPRIDDALDCLAGSRWFSVLDLRSGYYQIAMADEDKEKTGFICPLGFYEFERMPQGVSGAPATFQRLMERAVGDMHLLEVIVYLDDIIVFGSTLEEHEQRLLKVLDRLEEYGLKISLDKCQLCMSQVKYVGHIVSSKGVAPDPEKIAAVAKWKIPTDVKALRSFLGFCGFYRRFVKNYSAIVRPLTELTKGYPPAKGGEKGTTEGKYFKESEPFGERWSKDCIEAFKTIIHCLTHAPVLAFADPTKTYILHVDASQNGLGAVLNQEYPEGLRPVAYASRKLSATEQRYPTHQMEFLALKWAVVDKFHDYLYGVKFIVRTDNNPLTYVLSTAKLNATGHRWLAALATYDFSLQYKPGRHNVDADVLSRYPLDGGASEEWTEIPQSGVKAICQMVISNNEEFSTRLVDQLGAHSTIVPPIYACITQLELGNLKQLTHTDLKLAQDKDPDIGPVKLAMEEGKVLTAGTSSSPQMALLLRQDSKLVIQNELLYRISKRSCGKERKQLVLPQQFHQQVMYSLHDDAGHLGIERTTELVKDRFYWPQMTSQVEKYVKSCGRCMARKTLPLKRAPLSNITSSGPMELICIDFLSIEPDSKGVANVLVVTDHFTRYAQAYPAKDQKAVTVAKILWEKFFMYYGLPARIHSDQGRDFESRLIKELLGMLGIKKSRTTPYHPQGDPQPERFNRTLLSMLGTLDAAEKHKWSQHISKLVHAYNCTKNEATGYSPYFLLFGREARLPIDVCFGTSSGGGEGQSYQRYVENLKTDLQKAYRLASETALKNHQRNKRLYDQKVKYQSLETGDRVLIRNLSFTGKHKLEDRWNSTLYIVLEKLDNLPVYKLKPEKGTGGVRTMHRDHLLPVGEFVRMPKSGERQEVPQRPVTRSRAARREKRTLEPSEMADSSSESEHESYGYYSPDWSRQWTQLIPDLQQKLEVKENEVTVHTDSESQCSGEEEVIGETQESEDSRENIHPVVDWEEERISEGEEKSSRTVSDLEAEPVQRPKRQRKPVSKLSYDELGQPSERPITVVHRGIVIHLPNSSKIELCPPEKSSLPKCSRCTRISTDSENRLIINI
ncbi:Retrovirus-related Pol polyprotein from transposon 297 [Labeo rohita]|uniref:Gypsy retrotransposon integrase-like protein 1 n=1 Tax=Labeo rohita TaxID=84645 RepID=A0A498MEP8_LABRO|nr:Retrovirus-related Pol polyprotein from transposon 297 [Labeo rohita]